MAIEFGVSAGKALAMASPIDGGDFGNDAVASLGGVAWSRHHTGSIRDLLAGERG